MEPQSRGDSSRLVLSPYRARSGSQEADIQRERETERERQRQRETERDREKGRDREKERDREKGRDREKERDRGVDMKDVMISFSVSLSFVSRKATAFCELIMYSAMFRATSVY